MRKLILEMRGITKTFPGVKALSDVNLQVAEGEIHALCGENGAGKSTLMKVLSGVYPHGTYEGDILFNGRVCEFKDIKQSEQLGIVIIHQELALIPYLSIAENIFLGNEQKKARAYRLERNDNQNAEAARNRRAGRIAGHPGARSRRRQTAAGGDRQSAGQAGQAAHPGRTDGGAQRKR
ncbi:hypothetical protein HMSSN036_12200 [Paenibacillus macerans]|nr:hypothetical protein HMSSN036_12200 [Paenibacillus macerans]